MFATTWAEISGIPHAFVAQARGVFWDRAAWAWRAQDGRGWTETYPTWSEATAALDALDASCVNSEPIEITWDPIGYAPDGEPVSLSTLFGYKAPRKARKRKGKRK